MIGHVMFLCDGSVRKRFVYNKYTYFYQLSYDSTEGLCYGVSFHDQVRVCDRDSNILFQVFLILP